MSDNRTVLQLFRSDVPGRTPSIEQLDLGELAINYFDAKIFIKRQQEQFEEIVEFVGNVPIKNTLYVQKNGRDTNSGESWNDAVLTFERVLELAWERNELTLIDIGPGIYETEGHLDMPDNCAIRAPHRSVFIRPKTGFEERNVFRMGSGCFIEGPIFENWRLDSLENPTEGFAVCFRPGAMITRVPYAHKIAVRTLPYWTNIAPPLDRANANPLIGRGGGVVLADGEVLSPSSIFANIMTWGATPVSHNGIGYCAKNGALINAVNAVSLWAHKHFLAIDGGQIILSACSTQLGDFTMVSQGSRRLIRPYDVKDLKTSDYDIQFRFFGIKQDIHDNSSQFVDDLWQFLTDEMLNDDWTSQDEASTRRDSRFYLNALASSLEGGTDDDVRNFVKSLFDAAGEKVYDLSKEDAFIQSFIFLGNKVKTLLNDSIFSSNVDRLVQITNKSLLEPQVRIKPVISRFDTTVDLAPQRNAYLLIDESSALIVDDLWQQLVSNNYTTGWTEQDEVLTRRDADILIKTLAWSVTYAEQDAIVDFIESLFDDAGNLVFSSAKLLAFVFAFEYIRDRLNGISDISATSQDMITEFVRQIIDAVENPNTKVVVEPYEYNDLPFENNIRLARNAGIYEVISENKSRIVDDMWQELVSRGFTVGWTGDMSANELFTKRDAEVFLDSLAITLEGGKETTMLYFARSLVSENGVKVFTEEKLKAFLYSFDFMRREIFQLNVLPETKSMITRLVSALSYSLKNGVIKSVLVPNLLDSSITLEAQNDAFLLINDESEVIINDLWQQLVANNYTTDWAEQDEDLTRRDAKILIQAIGWDLTYGEEASTRRFVKSLINDVGDTVYSSDKENAFIFAFEFIRDAINDISGITIQSQAIVSGLIDGVIIGSLSDPDIQVQLIPTKFDELSKYKEEVLVPQPGMFALLQSKSQEIVDDLWDYLTTTSFTNGWTEKDEEFTRRDAGLFIQSVGWTLETANEKPVQDFAKSLFDTKGDPVFSVDKLGAFVQSFVFLRDQIKNVDGITDTSRIITDLLVSALIQTLSDPFKTVEPSLITAIGHTWTGVMAGVALTKIPPARNRTTIQESILELDQGVVIASGQDDQGSAIFVGGMEINADTGELSGPPFISAVNRIANKAVIARSF
jgi:hypothetical protein